MHHDDLIAFADQAVRDFTATHRVRHISYGILDDGELVHQGSVDTEGDSVGPSGETRDIFRIASMTKSCTAATLLGLAAHDVVALDDPAANIIPEMASWRSPTVDRITFRDLLTMGGGLPADNPWGDRQQDLAHDDFIEFLNVGPAISWESDNRFEYSNLGYAILGLAIERLTGESYPHVIAERLLRPLGMNDSSFDEQTSPERQVQGFQSRDGVWHREPTVGHGAFSPMGGLFSTVVDIARWVRFLMAPDTADESVLAATVRRSMQRIHRVAPSTEQVDIVTGPTMLSTGYGFGLSIRHDVEVGPLIGHSGGYPGFGSNMCWHHASGIGMVIFANSTYLPVWDLSTTVVREGARAASKTPATNDRVDHAEPIERIFHEVLTLVDTWDRARFESLFAESAHLDLPLDVRAAEFCNVREQHGPLALDLTSVRPGRPNQRVWWMSGEGADVRFEISLAPDSTASVQSLDTSVVAHPSDEVVAAATILVSAEAATVWPPAVPLADDDASRRQRAELSLALLHERFGPCTLGRATASTDDSVTFTVTTHRSSQEITIELTTDPSGTLSDLRVTTTAPPTP